MSTWEKVKVIEDATYFNLFAEALALSSFVFNLSMDSRAFLRVYCVLYGDADLMELERDERW